MGPRRTLRHLNWNRRPPPSVSAVRHPANPAPPSPRLHHSRTNLVLTRPPTTSTSSPPPLPRTKMRLPYAPPTPPPDASQSTLDTYAAITARRSPRPLQALDLALLHSPPVASGWSSFLGAIRSATLLPQASIMELAICRVAVLNGAPYEWDAHSVLAARGNADKGDEALGREAFQAVLDGEAWVGDAARGRWYALKARLGDRGRERGLSARQWAVVAFTDQSTRQVAVEAWLFEVVRGFFEERQVVELVATVAAYNCVSRFLVALDVGERNGGTMEIPAAAK